VAYRARTCSVRCHNTEVEVADRRFGSAVRDDFDPARSDVDLLVEFEALPSGGYADA